MVETTFISTLSILVSLVGICAAVFMFRSYQIDKFREKIFSLREEIFLYAFDEGLVDDCAHRNLRNLLNSLLRYAHKVNFSHMIALLIAKRVLKLSFHSEVAPMAAWEAAVAKLTTDQQEKFNYFNKKAMNLVIKHIILRSVLFWVFAICAVTPRIVRGQLVASVSRVKVAIRSLVPVRLFEAEALRDSQ
jgi:hypothetical protein